jgi:hypothetical protein
MKLGKLRLAAVALTMSGLAFSGSAPALAQTESPTADQLLRLIQQQQKQLDELRAMLQKAQAAAEQASAKAEEAKASPAKPKIADYISIGGKLEALATETENFSKANTSDITLNKVEAYIDVEPADWVMGHVQFVYEDAGSETVSLDEAYAKIGNTEKFPLFLQTGKWAVPFGSFETAMVTDPLTKSMAETKEKAVLVGAEVSGFTIEGYVYNGDTQKTAESNHIDQYGLSVGYAAEIKGAKLSVGAGYINNLADSEGLTSALGTANSRALSSYVPGYDLHAAIEIAGFAVSASYLTASKEFQTAELAFAGHGAQPAAWATEVAYTASILEKDVTFSVTAQGTKEALALSLPERRYGGAVTVAFHPNAKVGVEYLRNTDYSVADGGTGADGHTANVKLTLEY